MNFWWEPRSWAKSGFWTSQAMATWWEKNAGHISMLQCKLETWGLCRLYVKRTQESIHCILYWIRHRDSTRWQRMKLYLRPDIISFITHPAYERLYHTTGVYASYSLWSAVWVLSSPTRIRTVKELPDRAYSFLSLSEKTGMSNHL